MSSIFDSFFNKDKENREPSEVEYKNDQPENEDVIKIKVQIFGHVQGVGFRYTTTELAKRLGVSGIVRNENDGSVYVEALGSEDEIDEFITELAKGPTPSANVDRVVVEYDSSITNYNGFGERH
jgi:acylphosphatase